MKAACKNCGATGPISDFLTRNEDVRAAGMIAGLPAPVASLAHDYLELFSPQSGRPMAGGRMQRVIAELQDLVTRPIVRKQGAVSRPCSPQIWAEAIEQMLARKHALVLPMKSHNYLRSIAWARADLVDAWAEKMSEQNKRAGADRGGPVPLPKGIDPLAAAKEKWDKEHSHADQD